MLIGMRRARVGSEPAYERNHFDDDRVVIVNKFRQGFGDSHIASQFLPDLTDYGRGGVLVRFDFAPRKFPFQRQMLVGGALRKQDTARPFNHGANHRNRRWHGLLNKVHRVGATFLMLRGSCGMKTAFKVLIVVAILLIAIKFSPLVFVLAMGGLLVAALLGALGLSLLAGFTILIFALAAALSPIWVPVLLIVGLVALFRKLNEPAKPVRLVA